MRNWPVHDIYRLAEAIVSVLDRPFVVRRVLSRLDAEEIDIDEAIARLGRASLAQHEDDRRRETPS